MTQPVPTQELVAKDLHGIEWHFKHIFRGDCSFFFGLLVLVAIDLFCCPLPNNYLVCLFFKFLFLSSITEQGNHGGIYLLQDGVRLLLQRD